MKILKIVIAVFTCLFSSLAWSQLGFGDAQLINKDWKFSLSDHTDYSKTDYKDDEWSTVQLPHDWSVTQQLSPSLASATGYLPGGIAWYRKSLNIPANTSDKKIYLYFEGVYNRSQVYVNGKKVGERPNGYISFAYDITAFVNSNGANEIAVRVDHSQDADSRWYTGSGIYRNVWLVTSNPTHFEQWGVFAHPEVNGKNGKLITETSLVNETSTANKVVLVQELYHPNGTLAVKKTTKKTLKAAETITVENTLNISNPKLWDVANPNLYSLKTSLYKDEKLIDVNTITTGFRTFTFDANKGFALNGKAMKMKGVCLHHDAGVLGAAVPKSVWRNRLLTLKEIGVNAIRTSHNPQSPAFYEVCDEVGLLVLNEAYDEWMHPKRKWKQGWNVGVPGFQGSFDIFKEWAEKDLEDFVRRDRNHVSVFAWSIGNEVDYPNDPYSHPVLDGGKDTGFAQPAYGGYHPDAPNAVELGDIAKRLVKAVKKYDTSRPVTAGLAGVAMSNETDYPGALDIVGYNYTESKYQSDHEKYPERVIYGSENGQGLAAWKAVVDNEHIFGQFLWTGFDYLGESGRWPSRGFYTGLVDLSGNIKPRGYFRASLWAEKPMIYAGTYIPRNQDEKWLSIDAWPSWNYTTKDVVRVVVYTNTTSARLELDGKIIGAEKKYDTATGVIYWDVPYQAGALKAVGMHNGKDIATYSITTTKRPVALRIAETVDTLEKDTVAQLRVEVIDEDGNVVYLADDEITCTIEGDATLLGLEAANNSDMTDYTDNVQRAFHGKLSSYIQATGATGTVTVTFSAPWLTAVSTTIALQ